MKLEVYKRLFVQMANDFGFRANLEELKGIDCFLPILERIKSDECIIIIKFDGEREKYSYTLIISGKKLGEVESIRMDTANLVGGLAYICVEYSKIVWGWSNI